MIPGSVSLAFGLFAVDHVGEEHEPKDFAKALPGLREIWEAAGAEARASYERRAERAIQMAVQLQSQMRPVFSVARGYMGMAVGAAGVPQSIRIRDEDQDE